MRCLAPVKIRSPINDNEFIDVPCGKCKNCQRMKSREWVFRLICEKETSDTCFVLTLTYDNEGGMFFFRTHRK